MIFSRCYLFGRLIGTLPARTSLTCAYAVGVLLLVLGCPVSAETDLLSRAVGFALAGRDNTEVKVIGDRVNCVFAVKNELFHLNNVYTDRIKIEGRQRQRSGALEEWVAVTLEGEDIVFEKTFEPLVDDGSELIRQMRAQSPNMFEPRHYSYRHHELYLATKDQDQVKAALDYIYSHGCTGKRIR